MTSTFSPAADRDISMGYGDLAEGQNGIVLAVDVLQQARAEELREERDRKQQHADLYQLLALADEGGIS